jgi:hypothetical protein
MSVSVRLVRAAALVLATGLPLGAGVAAQESLTESQINEAIALGKDCGGIPLIRVGAPRGDFNVFIESPFARVAIHAAAARQMHQPFAAPQMTRDIVAPDYRIWVQYAPEGRRTVSVNYIFLRPTGKIGTAGVIQPVRERGFSQLSVGALPAHGIVTEVRWRGSEWTFDRIPAGDFQVILETSAGQQRYAVTAKDRATPLRVCS